MELGSGLGRMTWDPLGPVHDKVDSWWKKRRGGGSGMEASNLLAQLTRDQWAEYMNVYAGYEDKLIEFATDPEQVTNAMSEASNDVNKAFSTVEGTNQRRLQSLGLTLDADQQASQTKQIGLAKTLADVQAQNFARDQTLAAQQAVLGNPAPNISIGRPS